MVSNSVKGGIIGGVIAGVIVVGFLLFMSPTLQSDVGDKLGTSCKAMAYGIAELYWNLAQGKSGITGELLQEKVMAYVNAGCPTDDLEKYQDQFL